MPFDRFLQERIFDPLGMKEAFFVPTSDAQKARIPTVYHRVGWNPEGYEGDQRAI